GGAAGAARAPAVRGARAWGAGGEGRGADGPLIVVGKVAGLLRGGEGVPPPVHREDQVGLLNDLRAVQVEVGDVQQQRVAAGAGRGEVEFAVAGEAFGLPVTAQLV